MLGLRWLIVASALLAACDMTIEVKPNIDLSGGAERRGGRTQGQWRSQALALKGQIEAVERRIEQTNDQIWALPASFSSSVAARQAKLERQVEDYQAQLDALEDKLSSLELEARRAEVPPGWLR